jgi:hypothetical protein
MIQVKYPFSWKMTSRNTVIGSKHSESSSWSQYAIRFQMSILQDTVSKRREQITQWRDVLYQKEEYIVYIAATS